MPMKKRILKKVESGKLEPSEAMEALYGHRPKRVNFIFMRIWISESKGISIFLNTLFLLPFPTIIVRPFLKFIKEDQRLLILDAINAGGGIKIEVESSDVKCRIRLF
jgi:hypothetical protein